MDMFEVIYNQCKSFYQNYGHTFLDICVLIALAYAIVTDRKARKLLNKTDILLKEITGISDRIHTQQKDGKETMRNILEISNNLSTKYVGNFPNNMLEIVQLISRTNEKLITFTDVPAYGQLSNPKEYKKYELWLHTLLSSEKQVIIISGSKEIRSNSRAIQYKDKTYQDVINEKINKFHDVFPNVSLPISQNDEKKLDAYFKWLEDRNRQFEKEMREKGADVYELTDEISSHIWLSDDKEAIFTFYNSIQDSNEVSFHTKDKRIIDILNKIIKDTETKRNTI